MANRLPIAPDEWYHCYNRGVDKRITFEEPADYHRFLHLLYLCNSASIIHRSDFLRKKTSDILRMQRGAPLVDLGCFTLMSNHFHLLVREREAGGISTFMQKLGTAYTMYFNVKNDRTGALFAGSFKSLHVATDEYFQHVIAYIHCNPIEVFEKGWKRGVVKDIRNIERKLRDYRYSSLPAFYDKDHLYSRLLSSEVFDVYRPQPLRRMLTDATKYYQEINVDV